MRFFILYTIYFANATTFFVLRRRNKENAPSTIPDSNMFPADGQVSFLVNIQNCDNTDSKMLNEACRIFPGKYTPIPQCFVTDKVCSATHPPPNDKNRAQKIYRKPRLLTARSAKQPFDSSSRPASVAYVDSFNIQENQAEINERIILNMIIQLQTIAIVFMLSSIAWISVILPFGLILHV